MVQTDVRKAMTYVESKNGLKELSDKYMEDALHRRFSTAIGELLQELQGYDTLSDELERTDEETDWSSTDKDKALLAQKILAERASLKHMRETVQKKYDSTVMYENWLNEYGDEFAQLYRIQDNHQKCGYDGELEIREIDITDNGDVLTNDKYHKMNAYAPEPLTELVLHVTLGNNEEDENSGAFGFNFGVMEFNQPNMPPQIKVQLSFDDETLVNLDAEKLKRIFAFCESHGISVSDLQIRRFDGSLAEDLIRGKIAHILEQAQIEKESKNRLENIKEKSKEEVQYQELEDERQKLLVTNKKKADELSWDKGEVSADVVPEHRVMKATSPLAREFVRQGGQYAGISKAEEQFGKDMLTSVIDVQNMSDAINIMSNSDVPPVQTISKGAASAEIVPTKGMTRGIIESAKETALGGGKNGDATMAQPSQDSGSDFGHDTVINGTDVAGAIQRGTLKGRAVEAGMARQSAQQSASVPVSGNRQQQVQPQPLPEMPKHSMTKVEESFEKLFEKGWGKVSKLSYFKTHTGWFKSGWTVYTFYDTEDENNPKNDGIKQKNGSVKYTYSFKLFLRMESDGLHFAYRTPNHRKIDQDSIADIVGKLKDLGYTHINFPAGLTNAEKGMWRKAMAEQGIIPLNLGLTVKHAKGMITAMKETEKYDAKTVAEYGLKLAQEMQRCDAKDGKIPNETRQAYIDGLINTYKYFAFTHAYSDVLKNKIETMLRQQNPQTGSPDKFAAYLTLRRVFDVYKLALANGNSLLNIPETIKTRNEKTGEEVTITLLTPQEKKQLRDLGLDGNIQKFNSEQMDKLFDVLYTRQSREEYDRFKNLLWKSAFAPDRGAKLAPNVVFSNELNFTRGEAKDIQKELAKLGVEDFKPFEDTSLRMEFERFFSVEKPAFERNQPQKQQKQGTHAVGAVQDTSQAAMNGARNSSEIAVGNGEKLKTKKKVIVRRKVSDSANLDIIQQEREALEEKKRQRMRDEAEKAETAKVEVSQVVVKSKTSNGL